MTRFLALLLTAALSVPAPAFSQSLPTPPNNLEIRVVEGEGAAYPLGSRATRGVTVLITDEANRPVPGVTVGFTLPVSGPGGVFSTGARTEIVTTQGDGKASVWGMQWNRIAGAFEIRVTAAKGQTRAGILIPTTLVTGGTVVPTTAAPAAIREAPPTVQITAPNTQRAGSKVGGTSHKWLWIGLAAGGAAAAGAVGYVSKSSTAAAAAGSSSGVSIGSPTITLGH